MPPSATRFRFYAELNDFLAPALRQREFDYVAAPTETVKHAIEALGVPHTEVELILVGGASVGFAHRLRAGDRVAVYPLFEAFDITPLLRLRARPLRDPRFLADAQLGGLARLLRMLGFDTAFAAAGAGDAELVRHALTERRVILSRDRELLKQRDVTHGCFVRAQAPQAQLHEVVERLQLAQLARPFTRCLRCNEVLEAVERDAVLAELPPRVAERHARFNRCPRCRRLYWPGDHWARMRERLQALLRPAHEDTPGTGSR